MKLIFKPTDDFRAIFDCPHLLENGKCNKYTGPCRILYDHQIDQDGVVIKDEHKRPSALYPCHLSAKIIGAVGVQVRDNLRAHREEGRIQA
jgi:hypothetical protein